MALVEEMSQPQPIDRVMALIDGVSAMAREEDPDVVNCANYIHFGTRYYLKQLDGVSHSCYDINDINDFCLSHPILDPDLKDRFLGKIERELNCLQIFENYTLIVGDFPITGRMRVWERRDHYHVELFGDEVGYSGSVDEHMRPIDGDVSLLSGCYSVVKGIPEISIVTLNIGCFRFECARMERVPRACGYERKTVLENLDWLDKGEFRADDVTKR
jgi:hypothetical protein